MKYKLLKIAMNKPAIKLQDKHKKDFWIMISTLEWSYCNRKIGVGSIIDGYIVNEPKFVFL